MAFKKVLFVLALLIVGVIAARGLLSNSETTRIGRQLKPSEVVDQYDAAKLETGIKEFCSRCHGYPEPTLFPSHRWSHEIHRALGFFEASGEEWEHPDTTAIVAWYQLHSKPKPASQQTIPVDEETPFATPIGGPKLKHFAGVSNILVRSDERRDILTTDMLSGDVLLTSADGTRSELVYQATNPSRIRVCDLDGSGTPQYLLSDLGTPTVTDDKVGQVLWLKQSESGNDFTGTVIAKDLGRIADAQSCDFDGDGDEDVIVAEFGWDRTGSLVLLENQDGSFTQRVIDDRHGTVEMRIVDFDGDGAQDFVAILGQEFETVEFFRNTGGLNFEARQLYRAPDPSYGISSLTVFDNDADGDLDIVFTSGDMYDSMYIQKHHGVYLLTNEGDFKASKIGHLDGAMDAAVGDIDNDGDLDVVAASFIPASSTFSESDAYPALVLLEQKEAGRYESRPLRAGGCSIVAIELADLDGDEDLDLISGVLHDDGGKAEPGIEIWSNRTR